MKRFYKNAVVNELGGGYGIELDGHRIQTPRNSTFTVETRKVADAVATEWADQGDEIVAENMPMLRLANTAIDMIAPQRGAVVDRTLSVRADSPVGHRVDQGPARPDSPPSQCHLAGGGTGGRRLVVDSDF